MNLFKPEMNLSKPAINLSKPGKTQQSCYNWIGLDLFNDTCPLGHTNRPAYAIIGNTATPVGWPATDPEA